MLLYAILIAPYFPALVMPTRRWLAIYAAICVSCLCLAGAKLGLPPHGPAFEGWLVSAQILEYGGFFLILGVVARALMLSLGTTGIVPIAAAMLLPIFCIVGWLNFLGAWQYSDLADTIAFKWRNRPVSTACADHGTTVKIGSARFRVPAEAGIVVMAPQRLDPFKLASPDDLRALCGLTGNGAQYIGADFLNFEFDVSSSNLSSTSDDRSEPKWIGVFNASLESSPVPPTSSSGLHIWVGLNKPKADGATGFTLTTYEAMMASRTPRPNVISFGGRFLTDESRSSPGKEPLAVSCHPHGPQRWQCQTAFRLFDQVIVGAEIELKGGIDEQTNVVLDRMAHLVAAAEIYLKRLTLS